MVHRHATGPTAPGVAKTALGTERYLTWTDRRHRRRVRRRDQAAGYGRRRRADRRRRAAPRARPRRPAVCLAIGHEDHGLPAATLAACDAVGFVPQLGRVGSLNVATATAIAIYETRRQEWAPRA